MAIPPANRITDSPDPRRMKESYKPLARVIQSRAASACTVVAQVGAYRSYRAGFQASSDAAAAAVLTIQEIQALQNVQPGAAIGALAGTGVYRQDFAAADIVYSASEHPDFVRPDF